MMTDGLIKSLKLGKFLRFRSVMGLASGNEAAVAEQCVGEEKSMNIQSVENLNSFNIEL